MNNLFGLGEEQAWEARASCRTIDPAIHAQQEHEGAARIICQHCEVRDECLDMALDHPGINSHIIAGMTKQERQELVGRFDVMIKELVTQGYEEAEEWGQLTPAQKHEALQTVTDEYAVLVENTAVNWRHAMQTTQRRYAEFLSLYVEGATEQETANFFAERHISRASRPESYALRCIEGFVKMRRTVEEAASYIAKDELPPEFQSLDGLVRELFTQGRLDAPTAQQMLLFLGFANAGAGVKQEVVDIAKQQAAAKLRSRLTTIATKALIRDPHLRSGAAYLGELVGVTMKDAKRMSTIALEEYGKRRFKSLTEAEQYVESHLAFVISHLYPPRVK